MLGLDAVLVVRRTFYTTGATLKDQDIENRRHRALTDGMLDSLCEKCDSIDDDTPTVAPSSAGESWADMSDDDAESPRFPCAPPGIFTAPQSEVSRHASRAKKTSMWVGGARNEETANKKTTLLIKNVPAASRRDDLCCLLDSQGFAGQYNFVYMPANFKAMASFGYGFLNFAEPAFAEQALRCLQGFEWKFDSSVCTLEVAWSDPHQGLDVHVERYRNCPVMHPSVPEEFKPMLLSAGVRIPFPAPTKALTAPRDVRRQRGPGTEDAPSRRRRA